MVAAFRQAYAFLGSLDALVTSAGVVDTTPFMDISVEQFRRIHDVNVVGTWLCMREAARVMKPGATDTPVIAKPLSNPAHRQRIENLAAQQRIGRAEEIASGIVYLLSAQASFTHGANLVIDGGIVMP